MSRARKPTNKSSQKTLRTVLLPGSWLQSLVQAGIDAVHGKDREAIDVDIRKSFVESLDLDTALKQQYPNGPRWDYLLAYRPCNKVIGMEVHPASKEADADVVIKKKQAAEQQLVGHLVSGQKIDDWYWVASGQGEVLRHEKRGRRLDQHGILFVGRRLCEKYVCETRRPDRW